MKYQTEMRSGVFVSVALSLLLVITSCCGVNCDFLN